MKEKTLKIPFQDNLQIIAHKIGKSSVVYIFDTLLKEIVSKEAIILTPPSTPKVKVMDKDI